MRMNRKQTQLLVENWRRLLKEDASAGTHKIDIGAGKHVLVSQWAIGHIQRHNAPGEGSVFKSGVSESEILEMVEEAGKSVAEGGGLYTISKPGIGYDLVLTKKEAQERLGVNFSEENSSVVMKKERGQDVAVLGMKTSIPLEDFATDEVSLVIRPSNPAYLPEDIKGDEDILSSIENGLSYSLLTVFPGNPDIPPASQWGGSEIKSAEYVVIIPS